MKKLFFILISSTTLLSMACSGSNLSSSDSDNESNNSEAAVEITSFDLSDATAIVLQEETTSSSTSTEQNLTKRLSTQEVVTNLKKLTITNTLEPILFTDTSLSETVTVEWIGLSPTGEFYFLFDNDILINGTDCSLVMVRINDSFVCVAENSNLQPFSLRTRLTTTGVPSEPTEAGGVDFGFTQIEFNDSGNLFYGVPSADLLNEFDVTSQIIKWEPETETLSTILDTSNLNLTIYRFLPAPDGSIVLSGELEGESESSFFRFIPSSDGNGSLEESCVGVEAESDELNFIFASDDSLYILGGGNCPDFEASGVIRGVFENGEISYSLVSNQSHGSFFLEDSEGNIYVIDESDDNLIATLVSSSPFEEITFSTVVDSELSEASGDYMFLTGTDSNGNRVFMRKSLLGDREEIDLLGGSNLLVQHFDVTSNGDVYFGALDLDTITVYLYKYNNTTGQLEQLDSLSGDVEDILVL